MRNVWIVLLVLIALALGVWLGIWHCMELHRGMRMAGPVDPPIIVHGGSLHATLKKAKYDAPTQSFIVDAGDQGVFTSSGYGTVVVPVDWKEIQVCTDGSCTHGVDIFSGANSQVRIALLERADSVKVGGTNSEPVPQTDYEVTGQQSEEFYPAVLKVIGPKQTGTYTCTPFSKTSWGNCRITIGIP